MVGCLLCGHLSKSAVGPSSVDGLCNKNTCKACREMLELEGRIVEARRQLASLVAARLDIKTRQNEAHDPFVLRLPPEISSRIFTSCIDFLTVDEVYSMKYYGWYWDANETRPFHLASTCKGWRAIALSTPQLWTRVDISLAHPAKTHQAYLDYQTRLLSRSGSLPFSFFMTTQDKRSLKSTAFLSDLISLLNQHSTRWQIVEIDAPASIVSRLTGCGKPSDTLMAFMSWPNFTSLNWPQNDHKFCLAGGNPAPLYVRLRQLTFQSFHINWSKTTHADLHHVSITEFHNLLLEATLLESLFLNFHFDKEDAQNSIRERVNTILYPCLKELSMTFTFSTHDISPLPSLDDIFGPLILPKLQHLEFSRLEIVGLSAALARRSSSLRYLKLAEIPGHHEDVVNELGKLPSVETLEIASFDPHALLQRLAATRDVNYSHAADETFLPNLTALLFTDTTYHRVHWSLFISIFPSTFVEGRRPLRHLEIVAQGRTLSLSAGDIGTTRTYIPKPELEAFQRLIDCGCSLVIRGPDEESKDFIQASRQHHARRLSII